MKYFARVECADGSYVDTDGTRYDIFTVRRVRSVCGINTGYHPFSSLDEALIVWGLSPYAVSGYVSLATLQD